MEVYIKVPKSNTAVIPFSGNLIVNEEIKGSFDLETSSKRCSLDLSDCEQYGKGKYQNMCSVLNDQNSWYSTVLSGIKPPLKCPIKPGNYSLNDASLNMGLFKLMPMEGYIWRVSYKIVSTEKINGNASRDVLMCLTTETKIIKASSRKS